MSKQKRINKTLLIIGIISAVTFIMLIVLGNIIIIGEKIAIASIFMSYLFYGIMIGLFAWLIVLPIIRIIITPPLKGFREKKIVQLTPIETTKYISELRKNFNLTKDEDIELRLGSDSRKTIEKIINKRYDDMEKVVKKSAISNFVVTSISQNGSLDFISSMVINLKMINSIVKTFGRRPTNIQLIKLYVSVLSSSLLITAIDDFLEEIDLGEIFGCVMGNIGSKLAKSSINGLMNSFVTLRVGYVTIKYLEVGSNLFDTREAREFAIKSARKQILNVGKDGFREIKNKIKIFFE